MTRPTAQPITSRRWVAALCVAGLGLAACGDGGGGAAADDATQPSVTQVGSGETPAPSTAPGGESPDTSTPTTETTPGQTVEPRVRGEVAGGANGPTALIPRPGDDHLWVAERTGRIRRVTVADGGATLTPVDEVALDLSAETSTDGEQGLFAIAFSDDGNTLFASSTDLDGNTRVARYPVTENQVDADAATVLFTAEQPFTNHNGGHIVMGPDGALWLGLGDGGSANDPENNAQDPSTPLGKMVRIDPETGTSEIVASGLRNPWRFSFDTDDSLWIADVGQGAWEEIDRLPAGEIEGANLGWSGKEGSSIFAGGGADRTGQDPIDPVFEYSHDDGNCSITGGFVYRGEAIAGLAGAYLFADFCAGQVRAIALDAEGGFAREYALDVSVSQPISFGADAAGEPYVLSGSGEIVRLVDAA